MAVGIVTSGSAVGGIVLPIICQKLLPAVGFGWTMRILGFVSAATLSVSVAVLRQRLPPRKRGGFFAFGALKEGPFSCYSLGMLVALLGFYVFMQFVQSVSRHICPPFSPISMLIHAIIVGRSNLHLFLRSDMVSPYHQRRLRLRSGSACLHLRQIRPPQRPDSLRTDICDTSLWLARRSLSPVPPSHLCSLWFLQWRHACAASRRSREPHRGYDVLRAEDGPDFCVHGRRESGGNASHWNNYWE